MKEIAAVQPTPGHPGPVHPGRARRAPIATALLACALSACGGDRYIVVGTPEAPTTSGYVEVEDDDAGAWTSVFLHHLPPPSHLSPEFTHYVLWFQPSGGTAERVGAMVYVPAERKAMLKGHRPAGMFTVLVTAESTPRPARPGGLVVGEQPILPE